ncbi:MAG: hypothetical protein NTV80_02720, partial [Verrucomicrobia bacterium]|nr:hypothetical protein [Verrucomicrobiota bacterium]
MVGMDVMMNERGKAQSQGWAVQIRVSSRAYAWALWKIEAMILLLKLGEKAASLRFDLIEPFDSWSFKSLADIS